MGEVYRARDTRLGREIAIKIMPADLARDPDRLSRFEVEARTLAALSHPNILSVFDVGTHEGQPYLALELLQGDTLRARLDAGSLPLSKAIDYARQTAAGLAAAHASNITHRDIKPDNLFITTDGRVKILDFGLARLTVPASSDSVETQLGGGTAAGVVLGTVGYMSPEQVRGQVADHRSDLFSLGVVIYEMLAGARPFTGESAVQTMNAILTEDPPEIVLPNRMLPPALERLVRHCLEKNPEERFQSARDLAFALEALSATSVGSSVGAQDPLVPHRRRPSLLPFVTAVTGLFIGLGIAAWLLPRGGTDLSQQTFRAIASDAEPEHGPVWSPDGRSVAYLKVVDRRSQVFVRQLDVDDPVQLTDDSNGVDQLFWWPDATRIGFLSGGYVYAVSLAGGSPERLLSGADGWTVLAADLSPDGSTLAVYRRDDNGRTSIWLASPANADPVKYEPAPFEQDCCSSPNYLKFSPDGSHLFFTHYAFYRGSGGTATWLIPVGDSAGQPRQVFADASWTSQPSFSWMPDGRRVLLAFRRPESVAAGLWIGDIDTGRLTPVSIGLTDLGDPSVSPDSTAVAFTAGGSDFDLVEIPLDGSPIRNLLATSRDEFSGAWVPGTSQFVYITNRHGVDELRIRSQTEGTDRLIASGADFEGVSVTMSAAVPSPDGQRVAYHVIGTGGASAVWISPIRGGAPTRLFVEDVLQVSPEWSPDSQQIVFWRLGQDLGLSLARVGSTDPPTVLNEAETETLPAWSPDGAWIAYRDNEGLKLVSPDGERRRLVTAITGGTVAWSRDGSTLYLRRSEPSALVAVDVATGRERTLRTFGPDFSFGVPSSPGQRFTLSADGRSLLASARRVRSDIWILRGFDR